MRRRQVLIGAFGACAYLSAKPVLADDLSLFNDRLAQLNTSDLMATTASRELMFRVFVVVEAQGVRGRERSKSKIAEQAYNLIVRYEVSSKEYYEKKLQRPLWPGGDSGVTIGIGYDLGYTSASAFREDWNGILNDAAIKALLPAIGKKSLDAKKIIANFSDVEITWAQAELQFKNFLPYVIAEAESAFPPIEKLDNDICRGAIVSLVYNRGGAISNTPRRIEMYNIRELMKKGRFDQVPQEIRKMKRLWLGKGLDGLIERRELEARLFEIGLEKL